jgi:cardiolipin hydrolase
MKPDEIDRVLSSTLEDRRLSRSEKQALSRVFDDLDLDSDSRMFWRHRAFALAREAVEKSEDKRVLEWLESVVKALDQPAAPKDTDASAFFSPGDDCVNGINRLLGQTRDSADICVFTITDNRLADGLERAHGRGIRIRIITDDEKSLDLGSDIERLIKSGIPVRTDDSEHHMHHKYAVFDQAVVLTGSYNWTRSAAMHNRENVVIARDPRLVQKFQTNFEELWQTFDRSRR